MNNWPTHEEVQRIKDQYPPGTRIRLNSMSDPWSPVPDGTEGTVNRVDDIGQIHMNWDERRSLPIQPDMDLFTIEVLNGEAK